MGKKKDATANLQTAGPPVREDVVRRRMMPIYNSIGYLTRRLEQRITQEFEIDTGGTKLTRAQFVVLTVATLIPDLEQAELAQIVGYDRATAGVVIGKLEAIGYITRSRSSRSRRGYLVTATPLGKEIAEGQLIVLEQLQSKILVALDDEERLTLLRLLSKLLGVRNSYNMG
ncbi:hypothetical protein ASE85_11045 [Sphingobium sp. Leaf26]|uniref:MarR family winged helix-turn-helix transcriptional regulator n=1 Tax=Sphingobium sp. Leaf26 TaxID=1735693 RepID=UPI0006F97B49|nr:MarR family winged helix-turn-helix transcriptional regulator [Sphingobium sp. Leaf26]KQM99239.1 hypothetical protein ASE85_11045 [Sphingobium sp. Leaf26]